MGKLKDAIPVVDAPNLARAVATGAIPNQEFINLSKLPAISLENQYLVVPSSASTLYPYAVVIVPPPVFSVCAIKALASVITPVSEFITSHDIPIRLATVPEP